MTDTRYCPRWGCWVADCDPCECAARDRAEDQAEHLARDEGEGMSADETSPVVLRSAPLKCHAGMERNAAWEYASDAWDGEGTAYRNRFHPNPVHHIITRGAIWCSGSRGRSGVVNNLTHRTCPKCMSLAVQMYEDEDGGQA